MRSLRLRRSRSESAQTITRHGLAAGVTRMTATSGAQALERGNGVSAASSVAAPGFWPFFGAR